MRRSFIFVGLSCLFAFSVNAQSGAILLRTDVLKSAKTHYPEIFEAREKINEAAGSLLEAEGAFDATVENEIYSRPSGFYEGRQVDTRVVKPLPYYNAQVFGGYRISEGNFPIYEDVRITNEDGEFLFGFQLSLLRDSLIDPRRARISNAELDKKIAQVSLLLKQIGVQHDALLHYWQWVAAGQIVRVYEELLAIANARQEGFKTRVEKGDLAAIYLTENEQNILRREAQLNEALRYLGVRANQLGLYHRNESGDPLPPAVEALPGSFPQEQARIEEEQAIAALGRRPELRVIRKELAKLENERRLGENALLPRADLSVQYSNDQGAGDFQRATGETVVRLGVSIPLERRTGEGRIQKAKAAMRQLEQKRQLLVDRLSAELENSFINLETAEKFVTLASEEAQLAKKLQEAEMVRFDNGDSNFFVVNAREEKTAEAKIKLIAAKESYQTTLTHLYALTLNEKALGLK